MKINIRENTNSRTTSAERAGRGQPNTNKHKQKSRIVHRVHVQIGGVARTEMRHAAGRHELAVGLAQLQEGVAVAELAVGVEPLVQADRVVALLHLGVVLQPLDVLPDVGGQLAAGVFVKGSWYSGAALMISNRRAAAALRVIEPQAGTCVEG